MTPSSANASCSEMLTSYHDDPERVFMEQRPVRGAATLPRISPFSGTFIAALDVVDVEGCSPKAAEQVQRQEQIQKDKRRAFAVR